MNNRTYVRCEDPRGNFQWFMILDRARQQAWLLWPADTTQFERFGESNYNMWATTYGVGVRPPISQQVATVVKKCVFLRELRRRAPTARMPP